MKNSEASTLLALVGTGSRNENKKINGISHFLEHMYFKGTKKRPKMGQIHTEMDRMGAAHNAFTSKETTGFWIKSSGKDFDKGCDIVSDMLLNPVFKPEEIEKERGVILQEISMYEDEPRRRVWEVLENVILGDQPIGWNIAGTKETVSKISKKDIIDYRDKNYLSENTIIVATGDFEAEDVFKKIEKYFGGFKKGKNRPAEKAVLPNKETRAKIIYKDSDQTHLALGIRAYDMFDERRYPLGLLSLIVGGNSSSRLWMEIREKLGLAYYVFSFAEQFLDCGYFGIGSGIPHEKLEAVSKKIIEVLKSIKLKGVSDKELKDAKSYTRGQMALKLETSDEIASFCAGQEIFYDEILQPEEILKKIEKTSKNDILKIANDIFVSDKISMTVIGKHSNPEQKEDFYKKLFSRI